MAEVENSSSSGNASGSVCDLPLGSVELQGKGILKFELEGDWIGFSPKFNGILI